MRWWGWGDPAHGRALPDHALGFLRTAVGVAPRRRPPVELGAVQLPAPALAAAAREALRLAVGPAAVSDEHSARVLRAAGKGYPDLLRMRAGRPEHAPDAVVLPADREQVRAVLRACAAHDVAVVPFGGGTSVVGGVEPLRGERSAAIALDLRRLADVGPLDRQSRTVSCGAGLRVPALEVWLGGKGLTLGHFPQSYEYVSVGGCAATRSAGQASSGYGRFEELVLGLDLIAPAGELSPSGVPASAAGPDLRELLVGSEGVLGVICEVTLRVREAPAEKHYEGVFFESFAGGLDALRAMAQQEGVRPDVARLSDESETLMSLALAGASGLKRRGERLYLRARGYAGGCLAIVGFEGRGEELRQRRARCLVVARRHGGLAVGESAGRAWAAGRFAGPYLRDDLLELGVMVETLETATPWSNVGRLHRAVGDAIAGSLRARGTPGLVMCHVSHLYETGASLYFTFLARQQDGHELEQWRAVKIAASRAIVDHGGTITRHHAVGGDHAPFRTDEIGSEGVAVLRAVKAQLDPDGIMNPGKLLPAR